MPDTQLSILQSEWITLQNQFDSYEKCSLAIKLLNILLSCMLIFVVDIGFAALWVIAILWLQDGIWKTFQSRIGQRLEVVEQAIQDQPHHLADNPLQLGMQFNLAWNQSRPRAMVLLSEYVRQSLKPTVAYPHIILLALVLIQLYGR